MKTPYYTTAAGALAAARAIENLKEGVIEVAPLQSYARKVEKAEKVGA
jgi:carbamoyl-phosphate synthase large subunit